MPYCTQADIQDQLPLNDLIALTDDDGFGEVNSVVIERAISSASATIDSLCQGRFPLPLNPVTDKVRDSCVDLAIYNLLARRAVDELPKFRVERKADALRYLEGVRDGKNLLGAATPEPTASCQASIVSGQSRLFSRDSQQGL